MFAIILALLFSAVIFFYLITLYKTVGGLPGPMPLPLIGNALDLGTSTKDLLVNLQKLVKKYGGLVRLTVGFQTIVLITDPKYAAKVLIEAEDTDKGDLYKIIRPLVGDGIISASGEKWARDKRILSSAFSHQQLKKYTVVFNEVANRLMEQLKLQLHQEFIDITEIIFSSTLDIICKTATEIDISENKEYPRLARKMADLFIRRFTSPFKRNEFIYRFTSDYAKTIEYAKKIDDFMAEVLAKRKKEYAEAKDDATKSSMFEELFRLSDEEKLTDEEILDQVKTIIFTGSDAIALTLSFATYSLGKHPEIQRKILDELDYVLGANFKGEINYQNLKDLRYLECVLKETMRFYSPAPFCTRTLPNAINLDDFSLPAKTMAIIFIFGIHRLEKFFPDPEKFDPDRFLPENCLDRPAYAYLPFAAGPRACLGQKYAMAEAKLILAKIVRNFEIIEYPGHEPALIMECTMNSENGLPVVLKLR